MKNVNENLYDKKWITLRESIINRISKTEDSLKTSVYVEILSEMDAIEKNKKPWLDIEIIFDEDWDDRQYPYIFKVKNQECRHLSRKKLSASEIWDYRTELEERFEIHSFDWSGK